VWHFAFRSSLTALIAVLLLRPAFTQQEGQYYKKPETTAEFWRAMNHEIALGNYQVAGAYLKGFLAKNPSDDELLQMEEREGVSAFLRLLTIPELRADARPLVDRVNDIVQRHLSDRTRLNALIANLNATPEERDYAIDQLRRSGAAAMPAVVDALLRTTEDASEHAAIVSALPRLGERSVPALLGALDVSSTPVRAELINALVPLHATGAVPWLWYFAASEKQPETVRRAATHALSALLGKRPDEFPAPKAALTDEAERYYQHRIQFSGPNVTVWGWDGKQLVAQPLPASRAEENYGLRFARQALDLDPTYVPAQLVFLSLALEKGMERSGLDQSLAIKAPAVEELLTSVNPDLVNSVLDKALREHRLGVILGSVRALGSLADVGAVRQTGQEAPPLVRALYYPDPRVQLAAADSLLRIPAPAPGANARIVEVLRRALAADPAIHVLLGDNDRDRAQAVAASIRQAGFAPVVVHRGREVLQRVEAAADIDALLIDAGIPDPQLPELLAQLRASADVGLVPLIITTSQERTGRLQRLTEGYPNVWVMPTMHGPDTLKRELTSRIVQANGQPLTPAERQDSASRALEWLGRLGRREIPGYDIQPAAGAILRALHVKELAPLAVEAASYLPGTEPQRDLAGIVLDPGQPENLRSAAALALTRHIGANGVLVTDKQMRDLETLFATMSQTRLRTHVATVLGSLRPDARATGERLERYNPTFGPEVTPPPRKRQPAAPSGE
jgi:CheY-like chemotaxis protein